MKERSGVAAGVWLPSLLCLSVLLLFSAAKPARAADTGRKDGPQLQKMQELRQKAAHRQRRLIFNNDGDDALPYAAPAKTSDQLVEDFLKMRSTGLIGSQLDTIFYSTTECFSDFTHRTKVGNTFLTPQFPCLGMTRYNIVPELVKMGTDPLDLMVKFCRRNNLEIFWSFRMNDTHDSGSNDYSAAFFPQLKKDHPEYLVGSKDKQPPHGPWTAVDYARPEIRDLAYRFFEEVCRNYDVDGVELDFFRHPTFFKSVAWGGRASQAELDMMTDLLRRIRKMTDEESLKKGKPILISIRVPDSVEYCRAIGLDVEKWLSEGLVDTMTTTCYFQLNPWGYSAKLGHKYGVPVYASLSDSRVEEEQPGLPPYLYRRYPKPWGLFSIEGYRGYAMQAWQSGVDGIYVFNNFDPNSRIWRELNDPAAMATRSKTYFLSPRGDGSPGYYVSGGEKFRNTPVLNAKNPIVLLPEQPERMTLVMSEDFSGAEKKGLAPEANCHLWVKKAAEGDRIEIKMNGRLLENTRAAGESFDYRILSSDVKNGDNVFEVTSRTASRKISGDPGAAEIKNWDMVYVCDRMLTWPTQLPWRRLMEYGGVEQIHFGNQLFFADRGTGPEDMANLAYPWVISPDAVTVIEARARVVDSSDPLGVCIRVSNGASVEYLTLEKNRIGLYSSGISASMNTTDNPHTYRVILKGRDILVYADGILKLDGRGKYTLSALNPKYWLKWNVRDAIDDNWNKRSLLFGSATGPGTGEAYWEYIKYFSEGKPISLQDFVVSTRYEPIPEKTRDIKDWSVTYTGTKMPEAPWRLVYPSNTNCVSEIRDKSLLIADRGKEKGDYLFYTYPWALRPGDEAAVEVKAKVVSGYSAVILCNGVSTEEFQLHPDRILANYSGLPCSLNTADAFHVYRILIKNHDYKVYVDGALKIDGTGRYNPVPAYGDRNDLEFGASNSPGLGEALWEYVRWTTIQSAK